MKEGWSNLTHSDGKDELKNHFSGHYNWWKTVEFLVESGANMACIHVRLLDEEQR